MPLRRYVSAAVHTAGNVREGVLGNRSRPHPQGFQRTRNMYDKATHGAYR